MDKIVEGLNEQVEAGMINISMNTSPVFSDGTSGGKSDDRQRGRQPLSADCGDHAQRHRRNDLQVRCNSVGSKIEKPSSVPTSTPVLTNVPHFSITSIPDTGDYLAAPVRSSPLPFWTKFQKEFLT